MMSLYGQFLKEAFGKEIIEDENGFATFSIVNNECYVENVYVVPEKRRSSIAPSYVDKIVDIAKTRGCTILTTTVNPGINNPEISIGSITKYGFKLHSCDKNKIVFFKEL